MRAAARLFAGAGVLLISLVAAAAGAQAFSTPGATGNLTLDSMGAPPSAVWKVGTLAYQINETIVVSAGDVLVIPAGAQLNFTNTTELIVLGGLAIEGTATQPVHLGVVPDAMLMAVSWGGIRTQGAAPVVVDNAFLHDSIDLVMSNSTGPRLTNVSYQGRLMFDNVSGATAVNITMTITPTDVGRISLWVENSDGLTVAGADLQGGVGWGGAAVIIEDSLNIVISDLIVRDDNANLVGVQVIGSAGVRVYNYTFTQGPLGGDPNQALDFRDADDVVIDRLKIAHVGLSGLGAIYGIRSNATVSNSMFDPATFKGVWQYPGTLTGINTTRLPVRPEAGATVREVELVRIEARWQAGGAVDAGTVRLENDSWLAQGALLSGTSPWLWALRSVNVSGAVTLTQSYRASVTCNCTGGATFLNLTDEEGVTVVVFVGDASPPVAVVAAPPARTGEAAVLDASLSYDNAAVATYLWETVGPVSASGLPCADPQCLVVFEAPGNFTVQLTVTDIAGLDTVVRASVAVADATAPQVVWNATSVGRPGQGEPFTVSFDAADNDPAFLPQVQWFVDAVRVPGDTLTVMLQIDALGAHNISVIVRDDGGNQASAFVHVEIRDAAPPQVGLWDTPTDLVAPASVVLNGLTATDNVGVTAWKWRVVGPGTDYNLTGVSPNATLPAPGTYDVTLTVEDAEGNKASRTFAFAVAGPPPAGGDGGLPFLLLVGIGAAVAVAVAALLLRRPRDLPEPDFDQSGAKPAESGEDEQVLAKKGEDSKKAEAEEDADDD